MHSVRSVPISMLLLSPPPSALPVCTRGLGVVGPAHALHTGARWTLSQPIPDSVHSVNSVPLLRVFFVRHLALLFCCGVLRSFFSVVGPAPGAAPGETPSSVLDVEIDNLDKRLGLCLGGKEEVAVFNRFMFGA